MFHQQEVQTLFKRKAKKPDLKNKTRYESKVGLSDNKFHGKRKVKLA